MTDTPLADAIEMAQAALEALHLSADHVLASIEGQAMAMMTEDDRTDSDYTRLRADPGATGVDDDIALLRTIEDVIGQTGREGPLWLHHLVDTWRPFTFEEHHALIAQVTVPAPPSA